MVRIVVMPNRMMGQLSDCVRGNKAVYGYEYEYVYGKAERPNKPTDLTALPHPSRPLSLRIIEDCKTGIGKLR